MDVENHIINYVKANGERVEEGLQLHHLQQLMYWFQVHKPPLVLPTNQKSPFEISLPTDRKLLRKPGLLTLQELKEILAKVLQTRAYDTQMDSLFVKLDMSRDGYVDWNEFSSYLLLQFREDDYSRSAKMNRLDFEPKIRHVINCRQETTTKIVWTENPTKYVSISKEGVMTVWSTRLRIDRSYNLNSTEDESTGGTTTKRRIKEWITDAVYLPNCHRIAISSTGRDIRFYDVTTANQFYEEYYLYGLPDVPNCLHYWYNTASPNDMSVLVYGDDHGSINMLYFHRPNLQLFNNRYRKEEGIQKIYFQQLSVPSQWVSHFKLDYIHPAEVAISKLMYLADSNCVIMSTASSNGSVVITDVQNKKKTYIFNVFKGVECFDYSKALDALVTGSSDHIVRLWNPYVTGRPVAVLQGHGMPVIDIKIFEQHGQIFSFSRDACLKIWDMKEHSCIQTITIKFSANLMGRLAEYGPFPMHLQYSTKSLIIAADDQIALLKLAHVSKIIYTDVHTHNAQLSGAICNPLTKQVITAADDSTIGIWSIETGAKAMMFTNAHANEEITCLTLDSTGRRLITGARNGSIKVWNVENGHQLHQLKPVDDCEVTGIIPMVERKSILAVGWSRKIVQYPDADPDTLIVKPGANWKGGQLHNEDILTAAFCPPNLLATGSYDGLICVWFMETEALFKKLQAPQPTKIEKASGHSSANEKLSRPPSTNHEVRPQSRTNSRPNSRHRTTHKLLPDQRAPVDKLLFLLNRAKVKKSNCAILVSSESGWIRWWNVFGAKQLLGYFYAPEQRDESVLALSTDSTNSILVSGDTTGYIIVWNIEDYCTDIKSQVIDRRPVVRCSWLAHSSTVVSVDWIELNGGQQYILSASNDATAKLWTLDGRPIGTFGQEERWNISEVRADTDKAAGVASGTIAGQATEEFDDMNSENYSNFSNSEHISSTLAEDFHQKILSAARPTGSETTAPNDSLAVANKSMTASQSVCETNGNPATVLAYQQTILGSNFRERMEKVQRDRRERRTKCNTAEMSSTIASQQACLGATLQCCPYKALPLPTMTDVEISDNMQTARTLVQSYVSPRLELKTSSSPDRWNASSRMSTTKYLQESGVRRTSSLRLPPIAGTSHGYKRQSTTVSTSTARA